MNFFAELKRRNVIRVGVAYLVASWLLLQVTDVLMQVLGLPDVTGKYVFLFLVIGFLPVLMFSWAFEITPEGVKRDSDARTETPESNTTAKRLDRLTIGLLFIAIAIIVFDRLVPESAVETAAPTQTLSVATGTDPDLATPANDTNTVETQNPANLDSGNSLAVLPFVNMSPDPDNEYFSDGISEELLNLLVKVDGLRVPSRTSSFAFKGQNTDIREIARQLEVDHILEGSVRKAGDKVRITAQLIDVTTDTHLWSETYDRELSDIFKIQDEIARHIVDELRLVLGGTSGGELTDNLEAYTLYLQGRYEFQQRDDHLLTAATMLEQAVALDPDFAEAWATLSLTYAMTPNYVRGSSVDEFLPKATLAAHQAGRLNPALLEPVMVESSVAGRSGDYYAGIKAYFDQPEMDTPDPLFLLWKAITLFQMGYVQDAETMLQQAAQMDPVSGLILDWLARVQNVRSNYPSSIENSLKAMRYGRWQGIVPLSSAGLRLHGPSWVLEQIPKENRWRSAIELAISRYAGELTREEAIQSATELGATTSAAGSGQYYFLTLFDLNRDIEGLVDVLPMIWIKDDTVLTTLWGSELTELRNHPQMKKAMEDFGMVKAWREFGWPDLCRPKGETDFECD